ncbi:MAG: hypothetical protein WCA20_18145 [Candidatus Sulfotelmatobacter sp.]
MAPKNTVIYTHCRRRYQSRRKSHKPPACRLSKPGTFRPSSGICFTWVSSKELPISGTIQLVADDARQAKKALDEAKISYQETVAEEYELANKAGALAQCLKKLATKGLKGSI